MQCPSCGHQNPPDARFCDRCGAPLSQGGQPCTVPPPSQFNTQNGSPGGLGWQFPTTVNQPIPTFMPPGLTQPTPPATSPIQPRRQGSFVGVARSIQLRSEESGYTGDSDISFRVAAQVLVFRLEQYDRSGNRVRIRGHNIFSYHFPR